MWDKSEVSHLMDWMKGILELYRVCAFVEKAMGTRRRFEMGDIWRWMVEALCILLLLNGSIVECFKPFNVSYDHRAIIIDGRRRMLISAGIHYPRATPEVSLLSFS
eukprot:Gb_01789 [translate_table: standard]